MIDTSVNLQTKRPVERCSECDEESRYYNVFITPTNERRIVCWECLSKEEKGFTSRYGFRRGSFGGREAK